MSPVMFDSINVGSIPATGMDAVAGYVGGKWPTYPALVARFPHLPALSIAVNASQDAQCLDVEVGDATPAQVPGWLDWMAKAHPGRTSIVYCSASAIPAVRKAAGSRKYLLWAAHYTYTPHICGSCGYQQADASQFADKGPHGENVDQTLMSPAFLAALTPHAAAPATSTDWFAMATQADLETALRNVLGLPSGQKVLNGADGAYIIKTIAFVRDQLMGQSAAIKDEIAKVNDPATIAAAIPLDLAQQVVDALAARLKTGA